MEFEHSPSGKVIQLQAGYRAFIPNPLPPKIDWGNQVIAALSRADFLLGKLSREGNRLPNPHLLIRPYLELRE